MKMWLKILSVVLIVVIAATAILLFTREKKCCLCSSFRHHAPCLIDLETGEMIELDLYFPHPTLVAELSGFQPEQGTFSFVCLGNVVGTKLTDSKTIEIHIPNDKDTTLHYAAIVKSSSPLVIQADTSLQTCIARKKRYLCQ